LAILASPAAVHAEQSIELLGAGISVLCEKPIALSAAQAEAMAQAAARSSGFIAAGMLRRFFPATQTIRQLVSSGIIGEVTSFEFQEGHIFRWPISSGAYFRRDTAGGGVLMDLGAHALDLMIWWFGEPERIDYEDDAMGGVEVNCRIRCAYPSGISGRLRLSRDCTLANRYVIEGTRGKLSWPVNEANHLNLIVSAAQYSLDATLERNGEIAAHFERSFMDQIRNVIGAVRGKEPLLVPLTEAIPSLRLIDHCYAHRSLMPMPWLSPAESARALQLQQQPVA
jgi:predicted dehydrogenase